MHSVTGSHYDYSHWAPKKLKDVTVTEGFTVFDISFN